MSQRSPPPPLVEHAGQRLRELLSLGRAQGCCTTSEISAVVDVESALARGDGGRPHPARRAGHPPGRRQPARRPRRPGRTGVGRGWRRATVDAAAALGRHRARCGGGRGGRLDCPPAGGPAARRSRRGRRRPRPVRRACPDRRRDAARAAAPTRCACTSRRSARSPLLTADEEVALAERIEAGMEAVEQFAEARRPQATAPARRRLSTRACGAWSSDGERAKQG